MTAVSTWLKDLGLGEYAEAFADNAVDFDVLPDLSDGDLEKIGVRLGHRKKLLKAIAALAESPPAPAPAREAERRQITVMFCDLVGSTALSEALDPEDLRTVMQAYRKACSDVITRYDGHLAQYLGDGVMVYFGWPAAHEDDAGRAVRAGLDIVDAVAALEAEADLAVRIGIATGLVVVGDSGTDEGADAKLAVGETPNIAARIQGLAAPGTVAIAQTTRRLLGGAFALQDLGSHDAKGVAGGLQVHHVLGAAETESRFEASQSAALTPLVGRETEIAMVLERWDQAKDGEGQVVLLSGEAGIGKSRVTQVLRERLADEPHTRLRYQCSPYYTNSAFYPVIVQMERAAGFARDDNADAKLDKLEALLGQESADAALFASLLSLPIDRYPPLVLSPQKQKENTVAALAGQVTALAAGQPVLMIFEDAHWIDPTTLETLGAVIEAIRDHPVLLVITHRPEFEPPWAGHAHVTPLALGRLGRKQGANMVAKVTGGKALPDEVMSQIVAKTDGIPLFVEELTKTVLEAGFLEEHDDRYTLDGPLPPLAIPATLQDSLMARLDRLSPVKEVAQIGACIGREFSYELLAAVSPVRDNELQDALQQLINSELIFRRGTAPDSTYTFKHALVQDSAYESLLKSRRQQLHQRIASVLQDQFDQTVRTQPELLAHHLTEAGNHDQAIPHWYQAGLLAFVASAFPEAVAHLQNGLKLLPRISDESTRAKAELDLQSLLGTCFLSMYGFGADPVIDAFGRAEQLIDRAENATEIMPILTSIGTYHWVRGNFPKAAGYLYRVNQVAEEAHDEDLLVMGRHAYGAVNFHVGRGAEGVELLKKSVNSYDRARHQDLSIRIFGQDTGIAASDWLAATQMFLGYPDQAWSQLQRTIEMARAIRHPNSTAFGLSMTAYITVLLRRAEPVIDWAEECIALSEEQSLPAWLGWSKVARGVGLGLLGEFDRGIEDLNWAGGFLDSIGFGHANGWINFHLAEIYLSQGKLDDAGESVRRLREVLESSGETVLWPMSNRIEAEIDVARHGAKANRAEGLLQEALRVAREQEYRLNELRAATSLARLWQSQGKAQEAHNLLLPVYDWFTEGFDTADLIEAKALLNELS